MSVNIRLKHSGTQDSAPTAGQLVAGEVALCTHEESLALYMLDSTGAVRKLASAASTNAPTNPAEGDLWIDNAEDPPEVNVWNGLAWVPIAGGDVTNPDVAGIWERTGTVIAPTNAGDDIATTGALGVGTLTPAQAVSVGDGAAVGEHFLQVTGATSNILIGQGAASLLGQGANTGSFVLGASGDVLGVGTTAAQPLVFGTNNSERGRFDNAGRLLVGTASTGQNVKGIFQGGISAGQAGVLVLARDSDTANQDDTIGLLRMTGNGHAGGSQIRCAADGGAWNAGVSQPTRLAFETTPSGSTTPVARATIDSSGRLGVGNAAPVHQLDLNRSGSTLWEAGFDADQSGSNLNLDITAAGISGGRTGQVRFFTGDAPGGTPDATIDSSGRLLVGLGSSDKNSRVVIQGNSLNNDQGVLYLQTGATPGGTDSIGEISFTSGSSPTTALGARIRVQNSQAWTSASTPAQIEFATTPSGSTTPVERLRVNQYGQVHVGNSIELYSTVGTGSPAAMIDRSGSTGSLILAADTGGAYANSDIRFTVDSNERMRIEASGKSTFCPDGNAGGNKTAAFYLLGNNRVGLGMKADTGVSTGSSAVVFYIGGAVQSHITYNGDVVPGSDERLKTDLVPITDALDKVGTLRTFTGRYNHEAEDAKRTPFLIAQDVEKVLPEAVIAIDQDDDSEDPMLGLAYQRMIPLLVEALKESKERIEQLEARLDAAGA